MSDQVKHPDHYTAFPVEVIKIIKSSLTHTGFESFCFGNEIKYRMRAGLKGDNATEDIKKAMMYKKFRDDNKENDPPMVIHSRYKGIIPLK